MFWLTESCFMVILKYQEERITDLGRGQWLFLLLKILLYIMANGYCSTVLWKKVPLYMKQNCWISICYSLIVTWVLNPSDRNHSQLSEKKINIDVLPKKVLNLAKNASLSLSNSTLLLYACQNITRITWILIARSIRIR